MRRLEQLAIGDHRLKVQPKVRYKKGTLIEVEVKLPRLYAELLYQLAIRYFHKSKSKAARWIYDHVKVRTQEIDPEREIRKYIRRLRRTPVPEVGRPNTFDGLTPVGYGALEALRSIHGSTIQRTVRALLYATLVCPPKPCPYEGFTYAMQVPHVGRLMPVSFTLKEFDKRVLDYLRVNYFGESRYSVLEWAVRFRASEAGLLLGADETAWEDLHIDLLRLLP
jgi:hypothetical protein